jgi:small-conductance mechanosensitive channel
MEQFAQWLESISDFNYQLIRIEIIESIAVILLLWLFRWGIVLIIHYRVEDAHHQYWWRKMSAYIVVGLGVILLGQIWIGEMRSFATYLGLLSAGLAIALQGPITDLAGWMLILFRRPFEVGDRIQIGEHAGDVIDIRIFQFAMLEIGNWVEADQSTGRIVDIPNRKIFSEAMANYTQGFEYIWNELPLVITFESDWEKAKAILQDIADEQARDTAHIAAQQVRRASRRFLIKYSKLSPIVYTRVASYGIQLTVRYLSGVRTRRSSEQELWEEILRTFAQHPDINFAYPTQRFYYNSIKGQPQAPAYSPEHETNLIEAEDKLEPE